MSSEPSPRRTIRRSALVTVALLIGSASLSACAGDDRTVAALAAGAPLPTQVPEGTKLIVGDPATKVALTLSGEIDRFSFEIEWANISGGPQTSEAFRADALDVGSVAEIPPIHADLDRTAREDRRVQVPQGPDQPPHLRAGHRPRRRRQDPRRPARQEDRLQSGPGPGRAGAAGAEEGRADQGRRDSWSSCPAPATSTPPRWPAGRSTSPRSAGSTSSATSPSTARTAPRPSRTASATIPATSTYRPPSWQDPAKAAAIARIRAGLGAGLSVDRTTTRRSGSRATTSRTRA